MNHPHDPMSEISSIKIFPAIGGKPEPEDYALWIIQMQNGETFRVRGKGLSLDVTQGTVEIDSSDEGDFVHREKVGPAKISLSMTVVEHDD